jgi:hypothetical protein
MMPRNLVILSGIREPYEALLPAGDGSLLKKYVIGVVNTSAKKISNSRASLKRVAIASPLDVLRLLNLF